MAACDCYVSLHRAEGFGLTMAEAMAIGKPVIATGYSGNVDFMNAENSYLVDYEIGRVGPECEIYPPEGEWAEPSVEHAAELMRHVYENPQEARGSARARARTSPTCALPGGDRRGDARGGLEELRTALASFRVPAMFGEGSSIRCRRLWSSSAAVKGYGLARRTAERLGLQVVLKTYYSPIPDLAQLPSGVWDAARSAARDRLRPRRPDGLRRVRSSRAHSQR